MPRNRKAQIVGREEKVVVKANHNQLGESQGQVFGEILFLENTICRTEELLTMLDERLAPVQGCRSVPVDEASTEDVLCPLADRIRTLRRGLNRINEELESLYDRLQL